MMEFSEMRDRLRRRIGNPSTGDVSNTVLGQHINDAMREIMDKFAFHMSRSIHTFPTVAGTKRYTIPTDCVAVLRVWNATERYRIEKRDMRWLSETENQDTNQTGRPQYYIRARDWYQFFPIPDGIYTVSVFYKNHIADLSADDDVPLIAPAWHPGIVRLATYNYYDEIQDTGKSQAQLNAYKIWLSDKPSELVEESYDEDEAVEVAELGRRTNGSRRLPWDYQDG